METTTPLRVGAVQMEAELGNVDANLSMCAELAAQAAAEGATWIVLPEFFSTGVANRPELRENAAPAEGAPLAMLSEVGREHSVVVGGSTLVRDRDGHVRNAFFLVGPDGQIRGRHDKDLPTMWESSLYIGGGDPGRIEVGELTAGVALCWEMMRSQTVDRLGGHVDLVLAGSGWWSIPIWRPRTVTRALQAANERRAIEAVSVFASAVACPVVHAAHSGTLNCPWPPAGPTYHGHYQGGAIVCDAGGRVLAARYRDEGPGVAVADIAPGRAPVERSGKGFWLQRRGAVAAACWAYQNPLGRLQYRRAHRRRTAGAFGGES